MTSARSTAQPDVSVVILTRNRPRMLAQALRSALDQRGVRLEVLVVDNGSTDEDGLMVPGIDDPRVRVFPQGDNRPVAAARNAALAAAEGEWVGYLDDDDLWAPRKAADQIASADASGRDWVYAGIVDVDRELRVLRGEPPMAPHRLLTELPYRNEVPGGSSGVLARRSLLRDVGGMDTRFQYMADWDLWLALATHGPPAYVRAPHLAYRFHGSNMSRRLDTILAEVELMNAKHVRHRDGRGIDAASLVRDVATADLLTGHRIAATTDYLRAIRAGDRRARVLLPTVLLPDIMHRTLRRWRADRAWIRRAEHWLHTYRSESPVA